MEHTANNFGASSFDNNMEIAKASSEFAWSLSGDTGGPSQGFDPFVLSTYTALSVFTAPIGAVVNFFNDAVGSLS